DLENKINELKELSTKDGLDFIGEIKTLNKKFKLKQREVFKNLSRWQKTQLARHQNRPQTLDYINMITTDFVELHGDRYYGDGMTIVGGLAKLEGIPVVILGHQKGKDTKEKILRNFGMASPEDFRKSMRIMKLAEKFNKPIITFLDTAGAYPGIGAEERGQAEAIAKNLFEMSGLKVPVITVVIGEGGSGGALGIGVANKVLMLEYSVYSVISPEGCAAILWKDGERNKDAAEALCLTSKDLMEFGVIDEIIKEPIGGAHQNPVQTGNIMRRVLRRHLKEAMSLSPEECVEQRYQKFRKIGSQYIT
ncbi:MAG: acetyl-CoA carboxylase carboxyltransferase subunit alpha, partial [Nitrospinae bacterium]|nr:acetyl-CoA carboxylase carboxyltransferase subunit alpha [Nitrospinota bacterium]